MSASSKQAIEAPAMVRLKWTDVAVENNAAG
jgi:hypothetical protein